MRIAASHDKGFMRKVAKSVLKVVDDDVNILESRKNKKKNQQKQTQKQKNKKTKRHHAYHVSQLVARTPGEGGRCIDRSIDR